jgi:hypothetical protein
MTAGILAAALVGMLAAAADFELRVSQITFGPKHHFFGYIGHVQNIPWNGNGRYIAALETDFQDRMPGAADAARVILIDTQRNNAIIPIEQTRAWNFQQGTMLYWNPKAPDTQLFFNDRDAKTNRVFTVLYDVEKRRRVREFRYDDTPFANSGVAQRGGWFLGLNYGRLARLRPVTGYPEAYDWTAGSAAPDDDGIFIVNVDTGQKRLLVSYRKLAEVVSTVAPAAGKHLFINHTLWNRQDDRIYFYVRADFDSPKDRLNVPCSIKPDGSALTAHRQYIGGHPEWELGSRILGVVNRELVLYDVDRQEIVGRAVPAGVFPDAGGDTALSPDGKWLVNGSRVKEANVYTVFRRADGAWARTQPFPHPGFTKGDLRVDASPCWNRTSDGFLFPAIAGGAERTRQLFLARIVASGSRK